LADVIERRNNTKRELRGSVAFSRKNQSALTPAS
jgi:hypothetical protein